MKDAYVTKRYSPQGYVAVTKPLARLLYSQGYAVTMCGNNVNCYHIFDGWRLGCTINNDKDKDYTFDEIVGNYVSYNTNELLRYPVFYVKSSAYVSWHMLHSKKEKI